MAGLWRRLDQVLVRSCLAVACGFCIAGGVRAASIAAPADLALRFALEVAPRLDPPSETQQAYARTLEDALAQARVVPVTDQYVLLVDRNTHVQALFIYWRSTAGEPMFIGAAPVSTGLPGGYEHFLTPLGVFVHSLDNPDFRAEGTKNEFGIRGYGARGRRVFDFGWVEAPRTWGRPCESPMRLQMHATDPDLLEPRLGTVQSKGCIRIAASLDHFIDHYALLDADYEAARARGRTFWVLAPDREPTPWPGRYLVVIDSAEPQRPPWSPLPRAR